MIHYHGMPISGSREEQAKFLPGRHALVSYYYPDTLPIVMECCKTFVIDNGAFSDKQSGGDGVDFHAYQAFVESICRHPGYEWCLIPDKIDGTEQENFDLVMKWVRSGSQANGVPVWHLHESLDYLEYLVSNFRRVALGSSGEYWNPNTKKWWNRISQAMDVCCDAEGRPKTKLHGLRMLDPDVFTRIPLSSADSTNAGVNAGSTSRFGPYLPPTASQRAEVIANRIEMHNSPAVWCREQQFDMFD